MAQTALITGITGQGGSCLPTPAGGDRGRLRAGIASGERCLRGGHQHSGDHRSAVRAGGRATSHRGGRITGPRRRSYGDLWRRHASDQAHRMAAGAPPPTTIVSSIPTGSPCLDCGPTASDYMKLPPDATYGPENFLWEVSCRFEGWG